MNKREKEIQEVLDRHVTLGVEAIFSAIYTGPGDDTISFYHLGNRIMMVMQVPMTFVVIKYVNDVPAEYYRTNHHPIHKKIVDKSIVKAISNPDRYFFNVWHRADDTSPISKYYLVALRADSSYRFEPMAVHKKVGPSIDVWTAASYKLGEILDGNRYLKYGDAFLLKLPRTLDGLERHERERLSTHAIGCAAGIDEEVKNYFDNALLKNSTRYDLSEHGVLDKVFQKIERNISRIGSRSHTTSAPKLTNFLLFSRDYFCDHGKSWRHGGNYNYNIRILLCSKQRAEIASYFEWMGSNRLLCESSFASQIDKTQSKLGATNILREINDLFWGYIEDGRIQELLVILSAYFSKYARSMADPVFEGASFYSAPFSNDLGLRRVFHDEKIPNTLRDLEENDIRVNDMLRVITCHYVMQGFVLGNDDPESMLQVMLNPIEVGGKVWAVAAFVTKNRSFGSKLQIPNNLANYESVWSKNYHIYRDINERFKKNLRTYMNRFFEETIGIIFVRWISDLKRGAKTSSRADLEDSLNRALNFLSCVFPYNVVQARIRYVPSKCFPWPSSAEDSLVEGESRHDRRALLGEHVAVYVDATELSCFPAAPGVSLKATAQFVDATDVAVAMTDATIRWAVPQT